MSKSCGGEATLQSAACQHECTHLGTLLQILHIIALREVSGDDKTRWLDTCFCVGDERAYWAAIAPGQGVLSGHQKQEEMSRRGIVSCLST